MRDDAEMVASRSLTDIARTAAAADDHSTMTSFSSMEHDGDPGPVRPAGDRVSWAIEHTCSINQCF